MWRTMRVPRLILGVSSSFLTVKVPPALDAVGNEVGGVEAHAELADHTDVCAGLEHLHEGLGAGLGDSTQVVNELSLAHADTSVLDGQGVGGLVSGDLDLELGLRAELGGVREGLVADLVESIRRVGDKLTKEDLLVGVEGVDDEGHQLADISLQKEGDEREKG
jgi:hypothetical protein